MSNDTLAYFFRSGICLLVFYSLYWLFLRQEKTFRFNRYYLLSAVVISYLFPLINFSVFFSRGTAAVLPGNIVQNFIIPRNISSASAAYNPVSNTQFNLIDSIPYIYMAVLVVFLIRLIIGMFKLFLICKRGSRHKTGDYTIVYTKDNIAPFSFFSMIFINEELIDKNNLNEIIEHESAHIKQKHSFDTLFLNVVTIFQWYNPFIWLIKKALKETHEFLADEKVVAQGFDSVSYSELLIKQIAGAKAMDFANCFNHLLIKKRLIMLKKLKPGKLALLRTVLILPLALIMVISLSCKGDPKNVYKDKFKYGIEMKGVMYTYDSLMSIKSPNIDEAFMQALRIVESNAIMPHSEKGDKKYSYWLKLSGNCDNGKIDFVVEKFETPKDWIKQDWGKLVPKENIKVINYEEVKGKFPVIDSNRLDEFKTTDTYKALKTFPELHSVAAMNAFTKHLDYWGYAAN